MPFIDDPASIAEMSSEILLMSFERLMAESNLLAQWKDGVPQPPSEQDLARKHSIFTLRAEILARMQKSGK
jgi:hypothetical protein